MISPGLHKQVNRPTPPLWHVLGGNGLITGFMAHWGRTLPLPSLAVRQAGWRNISSWDTFHLSSCQAYRGPVTDRPALIRQPLVRGERNDVKTTTSCLHGVSSSIVGVALTSVLPRVCKTAHIQLVVFSDFLRLSVSVISSYAFCLHVLCAPLSFCDWSFLICFFPPFSIISLSLALSLRFFLYLPPLPLFRSDQRVCVSLLCAWMIVCACVSVYMCVCVCARVYAWNVCACARVCVHVCVLVCTSLYVVDRPNSIRAVHTTSFADPIQLLLSAPFLC